LTGGRRSAITPWFNARQRTARHKNRVQSRDNTPKIPDHLTLGTAL
jgi:hypothetical protein